MTGFTKAKDLGQLLMEEGLITTQQLDAAREMQKNQEKSIGRILVDMGLVSEQAKLAFLHKRFRFEIVNINNMTIAPDMLTRISRSYAEKHRCVPILVEKNKLVIAMEDPTDIMVLDEIKTQTGMDSHPVLAPLSQIETALQQYPALSQDEVDKLQKRLQTPFWKRLLHPVLFMVFLFAPLVFLFFEIQTNNVLYGWVMKQGSFDVTLYVFLSWALWAIFVWEIDGLFFRPVETAGNE